MKQLVLYKMTTFHSLFLKKKKLKTVSFYYGTVCHLLPLDALKAGEEGFSSPPLQGLSPPLPLLAQKPRHNTHPLITYHHDEMGKGNKPYRQPWDDCTVAAQATLPLCHDWIGVG